MFKEGSEVVALVLVILHRLMGALSSGKARAACEIFFKVASS
jgi:hypothetical protein